MNLSSLKTGLFYL